MFYFYELLYRLLTFLYSYVFTVLILFFFKEELIFFCTLPTTTGASRLEYLLFTNPSEIFYFIFTLNLFFSFLFIFPFFLWSFFDFLKTGLYLREWQTLKKVCYFYLLFFILFNLGAFFFLIPIMWNFFLSFTLKEVVLVDFYLELKAFEYYSFFIDFLIFFNIFFFFLFLLVYIIMTFKEFSLSLQYKRYIYLILLFFATFCTPPDLLSQVFLFLFLVALFEVGTFLFFYFYFYSKIFQNSYGKKRM